MRALRAASGMFWSSRRHRGMRWLALNRRKVLFGASASVLLAASLNLAIGSVRNSPIRVDGSVGQCVGLPQSCNWGPRRNRVTITQWPFAFRTIQATPDSRGNFSISIVPGRYTVSVAGCETYDWPGGGVPEFELRGDGSIDRQGFGALHWLVGNAGNCRPIPLGTPLSGF